MASQSGLTAELVGDGNDPEIGQELIRVTFDDGRVEELRLHDYDRLYSLPGVYEAIVHDRLGCRSPTQIAGMLADAVDGIGWDRRVVRVIDVAAGNGISGQALDDCGLAPVLGTDIVPCAREAALRDRPDLYDEYLVLDLLALSDSDASRLRGLEANVLCAVAVVGDGPKHLPADALAAGANLLAGDALVAYTHEPGTPDVVTARFWADHLGPDTQAEQLERCRYRHRYTLNGGRYELDGVVWRIVRR